MFDLGVYVISKATKENSCLPCIAYDLVTEPPCEHPRPATAKPATTSFLPPRQTPGGGSTFRSASLRSEPGWATTSCLQAAVPTAAVSDPSAAFASHPPPPPPRRCTSALPREGQSGCRGGGSTAHVGSCSCGSCSVSRAATPAQVDLLRPRNPPRPPRRRRRRGGTGHHREDPELSTQRGEAAELSSRASRAELRRVLEVLSFARGERKR